MSFEPPEGILDIGNATLRVGKLEVAETSGLNQGLQNIVKNDLLITENTEYSINHHWGIKLPTTWVADFDVKGHSGKYVEFNFYNEGFTSNTSGYTLNFNDTTLSLRYDNGSWTTATIPTIVNTYRKVNIFFERNVIAVSIDGTRVLYYKHAGNPPPVMSRVISTTGSAFVNVFIEQNASNSKFKNLRIVNGRFISDKTSNIAFIGGNLGVGVNSPKESLDIRGNMHLTRVSNVSQIKVDSNVVTEYTGPHDRPLRKYPEVAMTANDNSSTSGYVADQTAYSGNADGYAYRLFDHSLSTAYQSGGSQYSGGDSTSSAQTTTATDGTTHQGVAITLDLATKIRLSYAKITSHTYYGRTPVEGTFLGSNNNSTWDVIGTFAGLSTTASGQTHTVHIADYATKSAYRYIRLVVTKVHTSAVQNGGSLLEFKELEYYGHEEGSGSLDTTLKTVYNVPETTGTQLEVYYDAKDLTTMPGTVTDLSPNTNTGALSTSPPTLDTTDGIESFKFDASSSQRITSTIDTSYWGTNKLHSVSFWFKADVVNGKYNIFHIGNSATNQASGFWINDGSADSNAGNSLNWWFYGGDATLKTSSFSLALDTWYHIALSFDGSTKKLYVNGKHIEFSAGSTTPTANLPTGIPDSASLAVGSTTNSGDYFDGSIANFRVYGAKVLNADQVKELYEYQKDYFLGSKSQVTLYKGHLGVGVTEPSGQLELAGDERLQEYPPSGMTNPSTYIEGHGVFTASVSSQYSDAFEAWGAFSDTNNYDIDIWVSSNNEWYTSNGHPSVLHYLSDNTPGGAWIKLEMPYKIKLNSFSFVTGTRNYSIETFPENFQIWASNNGTEWNQIYSVSGFGNPPNETGGTGWGHTNVNSQTHYSMYAMVITKVYMVGNFTRAFVSIPRWKLFGTPGPTTLDKGSLTLGRSLDVPRVSRYDVDTETPRPEKLILDYDTTINNSPLDISGSGNHGTFFGHAQYSAADKAFKFDGTGDTVYVDHNGNMGATTNFPTGDAIYTMSCWIKANSAQYSSDAAVFYFGSAWTSYQLAGIYHGINGRINMDIGGHNMRTATGTIQSNRWYHVAIVKRGTGTITSARSYGSIYIDGVEIDPANLTYNAGGTQALQSIDNISIGSNFNGSPGSFGEAFNGLVSKPQIWNVALENSEIRKIYNLGRTGRSMVISDTAVGIGRYPRSQLDVRGIVRATTFISESQPLFIARPTASILYTTDNTIISNWTTLVNRGGFLKSSGYVYAPSAGVYYFHVNMYNETNQIGIIDLHHNGVIACRGELGTGVTNNSIITLFATVRMEAGDYVYLKNIGDVELISSGSSVYNQFVGYKLS